MGILFKYMSVFLLTIGMYDIGSCKLFFQDSAVLLSGNVKSTITLVFLTYVLDILEILKSLYPKNEYLADMNNDPNASYGDSILVRGYCSLAEHHKILVCKGRVS